MKKLVFKSAFLLLVVIFLTGVSTLANGGDEAITRGGDKEGVPSDMPKFVVPPPPLSEGIFPCSQCHAGMEPNPTRRELTFHTEISKGFNHAKEQRWCLDCHNPDDRDKLRLASGKLISFKESEYLCGQCHGTIFRDWKVGIHGKRTGYWNGRKIYRLCVHCHYPHWPRFKPLKPLPPPVKPDEIKYRNLTEKEIPRNPLGDITGTVYEYEER
ncbi:MAG: hypothetical protein D6726_04205 [Nitrospirae bacterium]|nr:MAG: hypothetical protein D6726_04205 [Nitrospirota bacterium]